MRAMLGQFLHDLRKVDRCEEIAPRKVRDHIDLFLQYLSIWQRTGLNDRVSGRLQHVIFWSCRLRVLGKVEITVSEEAEVVIVSTAELKRESYELVVG